MRKVNVLYGTAERVVFGNQEDILVEPKDIQHPKVCTYGYGSNTSPARFCKFMAKLRIIGKICLFL